VANAGGVSLSRVAEPIGSKALIASSRSLPRKLSTWPFFVSGDLAEYGGARSSAPYQARKCDWFVPGHASGSRMLAFIDKQDKVFNSDFRRATKIGFSVAQRFTKS
jgi:hypothetical protein